MVGDGEYTQANIRLVPEGLVTRSYGSPAVANQDQAPHLKRAIPDQSDPPDFSYIASPSGLRAQRFEETNSPNHSLSKRSNSTVTAVGVIAGGVMIACLTVLLLGIIPCYLKRRRKRLQKPGVVDNEKGTVTEGGHEPDNSETKPLAKPLSVVKEESIRSMTSLSLASSETAVPTIETVERRSPPPFNRPGVGTASLPLSPSPSLSFRRFGDRSGDMFVLASPPRPLLRPDNHLYREQLEDNGPVVVRSKSVRFAVRNSQATPASADSTLPNPWDSGEGPPPPPSSYERVLFQLPPVPESAPPALLARRAQSLRVAGLPRSPRDSPVSVRAETSRSASLRVLAEHRRSFGDARRPIRPI